MHTPQTVPTTFHHTACPSAWFVWIYSVTNLHIDEHKDREINLGNGLDKSGYMTEVRIFLCCRVLAWRMVSKREPAGANSDGAFVSNTKFSDYLSTTSFPSSPTFARAHQKLCGPKRKEESVENSG